MTEFTMLVQAAALFGTPIAFAVVVLSMLRRIR